MNTKTILALSGCLFGSILVQSLTAAPQQPSPEPQMTTTAIPGVVAARTRVERVWTGLQAGDGLIGQPDGTLLLRDDAGVVHRVRSGDVEIAHPCA